VDYIAERTESLMGFFFLLTVYAHVRATGEPDRRRWPVIEILACAAGMLCKETMVVAPVIVMLFDRAFSFASWREALQKRGRTYAALAATWILLAIAFLTLGRTAASGFATAQVSSWGYLMSQSLIIVQYLKLMIWPARLVLNYGWAYETALRDVWPYFAVICAIGVATLWAVVRRPALGFLGVWFFLTLAPASSIVPVATEVGAERRMYLPGIAVITLIVLAVAALLRSLGDKQTKTPPSFNTRNFLAIATVASIALCVRTWQRNEEYSSPVRMAETVVARWPSGMGEFMLGSELVAAKRNSEALPHLAASAVSYPPARFNLGGALLAAGRTDEGIDQLRQFIREEPQLLTAQSARLLLGRALQSRGDFPGAIAAFTQLLAVDPTRIEVNALIAEAHVGMQDFAGAVPFYRAFLAHQAGSAEAWTGLAIALANSGRQHEATQAFGYAAELAPGNNEYCLNVARSLSSEGKTAEALQQAQKCTRR